jgi:hypothetical protein
MSPLVCVTCAFLSSPALAADVGLRVFVQTWTPLTDDDEARRVIDEPTLISGAIHEGWMAHSDELHDTVRGVLGQGDLLAEGITLYDIHLILPEPQLSVQSRGGGGTEPLSLEVSVKLPGMHLEATSTTPTILGEYADPRCSIGFDLTAVIPVTLGTDVSHPFSTDLTPSQAADRPILKVSNFRFDSQGLICDLGKLGLEVTGYDEDLTRVFTDPNTAHARQINEVLIAMLQQGLGQANDAISSVVPEGLVRVNAWAVPGAPLTLAFSAPGPFPDPGPRVSVTGTFTSVTQDSGTAVPPTCEAMPLSAGRKTGPRPILDPAGTLGAPPLEPLATSVVCTPAGEGPARYTFSGLSSLFPNVVRHSSGSGCKSSRSTQAHVSKVSGLPDRLLPTDLGPDYDVVVTAFSFPCMAETMPVYTGHRDIEVLVNPVLPTAATLGLKGIEVVSPAAGTAVGPAAPVLTAPALQR